MFRTSPIGLHSKGVYTVYSKGVNSSRDRLALDPALLGYIVRGWEPPMHCVRIPLLFTFFTHHAQQQAMQLA